MATSGKQILLYIFPRISSFVSQDLSIYNKEFLTKPFEFLPRRKYLLPLAFVQEKIFLLANIRKTSAIVCHFSGYHSLLPVLFARIFGKPCLVIVGGTDCVSFPKYSYGNLRKPVLKWFTLKSLKYATHISTPSSSLVAYDYTYLPDVRQKQGYVSFDPSIKTPYHIIHDAVDTQHFTQNKSVQRKKNTFVTICNSIDSRTFLTKGLDLFIRIAERFPDCRFTIIGRKDAGFKLQVPPNVSLAGYVPHEALPAVLSKFTYYCQLSVSEGFGLALAEAMSCGCVPIVSKVGIMPTIAGNCGYVLDTYDENKLADLIRHAISIDTDLFSVCASERIAQLFNKEKRESQLIDLVKMLVLNGV